MISKFDMIAATETKTEKHDEPIQQDPLEIAIARARLAFLGSIVLGICFLVLLLALFKNGAIASKADLAALIQALVGSFFSLASGVIVFTAFLAQAQQLALQKQQMKEEAEEAEKTRHYDTLFRLINTYNVVVGEMDLRRREKLHGNAVIAQGRDCFVIFYARLRDAVHAAQHTSNPKRIYMNYFEDVRSDLSGYINQASLIIRYISLVQDNKLRRSMADVFRAQLSDHEIALLYYDASYRSSDEAKAAAMRSEIFNAVRSDLLMHDESQGLLPVR